MQISVDYRPRIPPARALLRGSCASCDAMDIAAKYGYHHVAPTDIENLQTASLKGLDFNRLLVKDGKLFVFIQWLGHYPFAGISIREIGTASI